MAARLTAYAVAFIVGVTLIAGLIVGAQREDDGAVDLIIINGKVYASDGGADLAEAVAVRGNKVIRVGSNREIQRLKRAQTMVIDAKGGAVMPGFNDAHAHLINGGLSLDQINLSDATTIDAIKDTVRVWSEAHPEREWITGRGWYYQPFSGTMPTRQMLDALVPDRPAYLIAYDGHTGWANTKALKAAGIDRRTKAPANGVIVKDPRTGEPTGALKEAAMALMTAAAPKATEEDRLAAIRAAIDEAHRVGITSVQDAGGTAADLELFDRLRKRRELTLRVYQALRADATLTEAGLDELDDVRDAIRRRSGAQDRRRQVDRRRRHRIAHRGDARALRQSPVDQGRAALHARAIEQRRRNARQARLAGDDARDRRQRRAHDARRLSGCRRRPTPRPNAAAVIASSTSRPSTRRTCLVSASSA